MTDGGEDARISWKLVLNLYCIEIEHLTEIWSLMLLCFIVSWFDDTHGLLDIHGEINEDYLAAGLETEVGHDYYLVRLLVCSCAGVSYCFVFLILMEWSQFRKKNLLRIFRVLPQPGVLVRWKNTNSKLVPLDWKSMFLVLITLLLLKGCNLSVRGKGGNATARHTKNACVAWYQHQLATNFQSDGPRAVMRLISMLLMTCSSVSLNSWCFCSHLEIFQAANLRYGALLDCKCRYGTTMFRTSNWLQTKVGRTG